MNLTIKNIIGIVSYMTKIKYAKFRLSRRIGKSVHGHPQDAINFRNYFCGQHGQTSIRKNSEYAVQLIAKQAIKYHHNITEKQLRKYYTMASNMNGNANENLLVLLNKRLDITVFRLGITPTMYSACQLVSHNHVLVNGKKVNIRSYLLKEGDIITLTEKAKKFDFINASISNANRSVPSYLSVDDEKMEYKYVRNPAFGEVPYPFNAEFNLIIELYSR